MEFVNSLTRSSWMQINNKKRAWWFYSDIHQWDRKYWFANNAPMTYDKTGANGYEAATPNEGLSWITTNTFVVALSDSIIIVNSKLPSLLRVDRSLNFVSCTYEQYTRYGIRELYRDGDNCLSIMQNPTIQELRKYNADYLFAAAIIMN